MEAEDFANVLLHEYDPQKRREYYLKNRKLKGRTKTAKLEAAVSRTSSIAKSSKVKKKASAAERNRKATAELAALKVRLEALRSIVKDLVEAAKKRSGTKTTEKKETEKKRESSDLSAADKKKAAERSKKYYEKNKDTPAGQVKEIKAQIAKLQERIAKLRAEAKADEPAKKAEAKPKINSAVTSSTSNK